MDMITFDALAAQHRKSLEARMRKAKTVRNNLTRMVEESIQTINKRAEEDKEQITEIFTTLISHQEQEIALLREELGIGKEKPNDSMLAGSDSKEVEKPAIMMPTFQNTERKPPGRLTPGIKRRTT